MRVSEACAEEEYERRKRGRSPPRSCARAPNGHVVVLPDRAAIASGIAGRRTPRAEIPITSGLWCVIIDARATAMTERRSAMNQETTSYGHRARIGYVCPPSIAEIVPYEFYKIVPEGVTLVITTLTVTAPSKAQVEQAHELSMRAARELADAG